MVGLRKLWDLGDPTAPDPEALQRIEHDKRAFTDAMGRLNSSLQYTAANAPQSSHDKLARRRDTLYGLYQKAVAASRDDAAALPAVLAQATGLGDAAVQLAKSTRHLKQRWEEQAATLESTEDAITQASDQGDETAPLQQGLSKVVDAARHRDYQTACDELERVAGAAKTQASTAAGALQQDGTTVNEKRYELKGALDRAPVVPTDRAVLANWKNPLIDGDPRALFKPERMDDVADMHFQGEATEENPALNTALKAVLFAEPGADVSEQIAKIGELRGLDPATVQAQYQRFQQLQGTAQQLETARGLPPDEVMTTRTDEYLETHGDFLGTRSSLRFGQAVGAATGLDPAFAAMLNPTGGMVGPGMDVLAPTDANSPVILHGIFHDAGGYLLNYQNTGPGYTYLGDKQPESGRRGADPLQGQVEGVSYWYERRQPDRSVLEDLYAADGEEMAYDAYVKAPIGDAEQFASELTQDAVDAVRTVADGAAAINQNAASGLKAATHGVANGVDVAVQAADSAVDAFADTVRDLGVDLETVTAAEAAIDQQLGAVREQVAEWDHNMGAAIDTASALVGDSIDGLRLRANEAGDAFQGEISRRADEAEEAVHDALVRLGQNEDLLEFARAGINRYGETAQDMKALQSAVSERIDRAKTEAAALYEQAQAEAGEKLAAGKALVDSATDELAGMKDDLIDKLAAVRETAARGVDTVADEICDVRAKLEETGQDFRDAATGIVDSMADAVDSGTDTLANAMGSATEFAAERLDSLTNLLG